ncbi:MAG: DUF4401 domain-containing protein [Lysobacter sp.]|nr:DUF4401 domain-containing protein [Lysobacter sp.]
MSANARMQALWLRLTQAEVISGDAPDIDDDTPWYLAALIGVSAWIAALFFHGFFLALFDGLHNEPALALPIGAGCCAVAWLLLRVARGRDFIEQFAIATSLVGQLLIGAAFFEWGERPGGDDHWRLAWLGVGSVAAAMYAIGRLPMHRFLCGVIVAVALLAVCLVGDDATKHFAIPLLAWAMFAAWWRSAGHDRLAVALPPLAWALGLVLLFSTWFVARAGGLFTGRVEQARDLLLVADALVVPLLPLCAYWLAARQPALDARGRLFAFVFAAGFALLLWRAPGVSIGITLALIGFALYRPALLAVGLLGTAAYLFDYYYHLQLTLLEKSGWLAAAGVAVLAVRWAHVRFARKEAA